jgi:hypothetical protein
MAVGSWWEGSREVADVDDISIFIGFGMKRKIWGIELASVRYACLDRVQPGISNNIEEDLRKHIMTSDSLRMSG